MLEDGSRVVPADARYPAFLPMPLKDGEQPRPCDVVVCSSCPYRVEPPPHVVRLRQLGIRGNFDPETGRADIVHVMTTAEQWVQHGQDYVDSTPAELRGVFVATAKQPDLQALISATGCRLVIAHTGWADPVSIREASAAFPDVRFWGVLHGSQASMCVNQKWAKQQRELLALSNELPSVWYGTPEPTAKFFADCGYSRYLEFPNTIPFEMPSGPPVVPNPPVLLIAGRDDIIKARPTAVLAAGLVAKRRKVIVSTSIKGSHGALDDVAGTLGLTLDRQAYRTPTAFRSYLRSSVSLLLNSTMTEAMQYVGLDALSQGRPVVGSQTIRYLPREWQADPNDPADIARVAMMFLDDYPRYSAEALRLAGEIRDRQRDAYHAAVAKILGDK